MSGKESKNKITGWRIIGVSGETADGRQISAEALKQMAESYDPAVYGARINLEHTYFTFPGWAGGYGDVVELKAEPWHKDKDKTALLAKLSILPNLQELWDGGEKIYTSMEIAPDFAKSGKAYLVGLAITDSPASLGTTANFTTAAQADRSKTFTSYHLTETNESEPPMTQPAGNQTDKPLTADAAEGIFARLFAKFAKTGEKPAEEAGDIPSETPPAEEPDKKTEEISAKLNQAAELLEKFAEKAEAQDVKIAALEKQLAEFKNQLESTAVTGNRAPHTGAPETACGAGW